MKRGNELGNPDVTGPDQKKQRPSLDREATVILPPVDLQPPRRSELKRTLTPLNLQHHADLPSAAKVRLYPHLRIGGDGRISRLIISRLQRTPSPFKGGRMGDHTVAWQALVDSVCALVHGKTVLEAAAALRDRQNEVSAWMDDAESPVKKLLLKLEDSADRTVLLEDSAWQVTDLLKKAVAAAPTSGSGPRTDAGTVRSSDRAEANLALAIAQHLAYLNYLPFATVPAKSARGSRGSGEGTHRAVVLEVEKVGPPDLVSPVGGRDRIAAVRDALWGLFAFDAALREAQTELAVVPNVAALTTTTYDDLKRLARSVVAEADEILLLGELKGRGKRVDARKATAGLPKPTPPKPELTPKEVMTQVGPYTGRLEEYPELSLLAGRIKSAAEYLSAIVPGPQYAGVHDAVDKHKERIGMSLTDAEKLNTDIKAQGAGAVQNTADILAYLLHDHQTTVARAYPRTVLACGFFRPSALAEAVGRLKLEIEGQIGGADPEKVEGLLLAVQVAYEELGSAPKPARSNGWVAESATEDLVVTHPEGGPLRVVGRAPAPAGVEGMGSHSTAWVVERLAADALVSGVREKPAKIAALRAEVQRDLAGEVMGLDWLLPTEQLEAGQLDNIFDSALAVFEAADLESAAVAYLTFRNVLPFATVDAGDRGGHGESINASKEKLFDRASLEDAARLKADELFDNDRRQAASRALVKVARRLATRGNPAWGLHDAIRSAKAACESRLMLEAAKLAGGVPDRKDVVARIVDTRDAEHEKVYKIALTSRLKQ